jgi:hypothetical protein
MTFTRRTLALALVPAAPAQEDPPPPANAEEELQRAREQVRRNAGMVSQYVVPMATEPACQFKA